MYVEGIRVAMMKSTLCSLDLVAFSHLILKYTGHMVVEETRIFSHAKLGANKAQVDSMVASKAQANLAIFITLNVVRKKTQL